MKKSRTVHLQQHRAGEPFINLHSMIADLEDAIEPTLRYMPGVFDRPAKGRRKVRITITVEAVK